MMAVVGAGAWISPQLPALDEVIDYKPRQPLQVLTQDGVPIAQLPATPDRVRKAILEQER